MSPALTLIDVAGRRHRIASLDGAAQAIRTADELHALGGARRISTPGGETFSLPQALPFLVYYRSHALQASSREIARAARIIARSEAVAVDSRGKDCPVTGTRALAYADRANPSEGRVCFLVSRLVWYNHNRALAFPRINPINQQETDALTAPRIDPAWGQHVEDAENFLADVNRRLEEGEISFPR